MKIKEIKEPLIFIALKRVCSYLVNDIWPVHIGADPIGEAEFKLSVAKSKEYENEIILLSQIDTDLNWGDKKYKTDDKRHHIFHEGDFNPWYPGDLNLENLINSLKEIVSFETSGDHEMQYGEFEHYFNLLREFIGDTDNKLSPESDIAYIKSIMTEVATGQAHIQDKNIEYQNLYQRVNQYFTETKTTHLNQFADLWEFHSFWKKKLKTYSDRRAYISRLYKKMPEFSKRTPILKSRKHQYVNENRIRELQSVKNNNFDLVKLLRYCEEVNIAFESECYLATVILVRSILDHVSPIFGVATFSEVTGKGSRSFKESMNSLNKSLRKIADSYLHTHIRSKETLPNFTQVDFSNDLDVLLGEIYRLLK